jgi:L-lactate utilization protein LutC
MLQTASSAALEQFEAAAIAAVSTVEIIERSPEVLCDAILRKAGDSDRILFAPPQDLPHELFADFVRDPRVISEPSPDDMVHSPAGVTEAFAGVARTGSVCVDVGYQRTGMASLLAPFTLQSLPRKPSFRSRATCSAKTCSAAKA